MENKVITIYDIAKEAGVSPATVSRVLTNNANVRPQKKEIVQRIIDKYNFKPNALARGLSDTKSKIIGIIEADVRNPFYAEVFVACEQAARKAGYTVLLCNSLGEQAMEEQQLEKLEEQRVDAIIQLGGRADDLQSNISYVERVNQLTNTIPVIISGKLDGTDCYEVRIDARHAIDLLMKHLISLHHKKIAIVGGRPDVVSTFEKVQRYKQLLAKYEISYEAICVEEEGGYDYETGYRIMNQILNHEREGISEVPTGVIAINDFCAMGVVRSIIEHDLKIPEDISVVSYDNTYVANLMMPQLTSVDYNYEEFGEKLVNTAIAAIEGRVQERRQYVGSSLAVRESSGPAKA